MSETLRGRMPGKLDAIIRLVFETGFALRLITGILCRL
jgi:hypothetical protein